MCGSALTSLLVVRLDPHDKEAVVPDPVRRAQDSRGLHQNLPQFVRDSHVQGSAQGQGRIQGVPVEEDREAVQGQRPDLERLDVDPDAGETGGHGNHAASNDHDRSVKDGARGYDAADLAVDPSLKILDVVNQDSNAISAFDSNP